MTLSIETNVMEQQLRKVALALEEEIKELYETLDRQDNNGLGTFQLSQKLQKKIKELDGIKKFIKQVEPQNLVV